MVAQMKNNHGLSERRACGLLEITRRSFRREAAAPDRNQELRERLRALAEERRRWGCPLLYRVLRREGWRINHKRVDVSLNGERVKRVLDRLRLIRGLPATIQVDNGPEFTSRVLDQWACDNQVRLEFIEPGKPIQNAFIESFNSRLREECLNEHVFVLLDDARRKIQLWQGRYNFGCCPNLPANVLSSR